ncbi:hypothetical protein Tco_1553587 [Tanacetum coccineum]
MDDPNITMEEYIRLQEEKALSRGESFDWKTATYGKTEYCENEDECFTDLESKFPAIVLDDALTYSEALSWKPTISPLNENEIDFKISFDESDDEDYMVIFDENSFSYKIISVDNLKTDSKNKNDKVNMPSSPSPEPTISYIDDLDFFKYFENEFPAIAYNDDLKSKSDPLIEPSISSRQIDEFDLKNETSLSEFDEDEQNVLYFDEIFSFNAIFPNDLKSKKDIDDDEMQHDLEPLPFRHQRHPWLRLRMVYTGDEGQELFTSHAWMRLFEIRAPLVREFILEFLSTCRMSDTEMGLDEEMAEDGFGAYWLGSERVIPGKGDLWDYWIEISFDRDLLGPAPSYVFIREPVRRQFHRMIVCSISGRGMHLRRYVEERKSGARLFGVTSWGVLQLILDWSPWDQRGSRRVRLVPLGAAEDAPAIDEGAQADPAPEQAS